MDESAGSVATEGCKLTCCPTDLLYLSDLNINEVLSDGDNASLCMYSQTVILLKHLFINQ